MVLPRVAPLGRLELLRFELGTGLATALTVLRRHLGIVATLRAATALALRSSRDPLSGVPKTDWPAWQEELTRRQLRPVLLMDDILREVLGLSDADRLAVLGELVAETGARFVERSVPELPLERWSAAPEAERERFVRELSARLPNARVERFSVGDDRLSFDISACRFVELCRAAGRHHLAALFCDADSRHFDGAGSLLRLRREGTIARGATHCDFAFEYRKR